MTERGITRLLIHFRLFFACGSLEHAQKKFLVCTTSVFWAKYKTWLHSRRWARWTPGRAALLIRRDVERVQGTSWSWVELAETANFRSGQKAAEEFALREAGTHMQCRHNTFGIVRVSYCHWVTTRLRHRQLIYCLDWAASSVSRLPGNFFYFRLFSTILLHTWTMSGSLVLV